VLQVALVPVDAFGDDKDVRLYFVAAMSTLQEVMEKLKEAATRCGLTKAVSITDIFTSNTMLY
jgi:hypothetical protein